MKVPSARPDISEITEKDYEFSDVRKTEQEACCFYEYARESLAVRKEAEHLRNHRRRQRRPGKVPFTFKGTLVQQNLVMQLSFISAFPDAPFQLLTGTDRERIVKLPKLSHKIYRYGLFAQTPPLSLVSNEPRTSTLEMWEQTYRKRCPAVPNGAPIKFGFFAVNLGYNDDVLEEWFRQSLKTLRDIPILSDDPPRAKPPKPQRRGRQSFRDQLKRLGALRLRYCCKTFREAQALMKHYADRRSFNLACKGALKQFKNWFGWIDSEPPIHFTEGW